MIKNLIQISFLIFAIFLLLALNGNNNLNYVYAHSLPVTETPGPNSIINKGAPLPSKITIDFSERPDPNVSTIQVLNSKNERMDNGKF
ncbi:MAG: hypothetical protein WBP64_09800, partial [Nitrososphaeraceae archaeon]